MEYLIGGVKSNTKVLLINPPLFNAGQKSIIEYLSEPLINLIWMIELIINLWNQLMQLTHYTISLACFRGIIFAESL